MARLMQYVGAVIIANSCMCLGVIFSWPSSTLRLFESANTTLNRPMTESELSLLGSLSSVGALISTPVVGLTLDRFGRKNLSIISSLLAVIGWAIIAFCNRVEVVLAAMLVCGFSGGVFVIDPIFISEICEESIRGGMTAVTIISYGFGMLFSYFLGGYLEYKAVIYVCLTLSTVTTALLAFIKESPICLMIQNKEKEAAESIGFYRSLKPDSKEVLEELNIIKRSFNPELDDITPEEEKQLKPEKQTKENIGFIRFLRKSRSTRAAFYMIITLVTATIFQGFVVVQVYAEPLFEDALPSMSPNNASILLAVLAIPAGFVSAYLTEFLGRRPLMIYSSFASAASCLLIGLQLHLQWGPSWLIGVNIYFFSTVYTFGGGTVPYVLVAEIFLPEVRSLMSMVVIEWAWFCYFIILYIFNPLVKAFGLGLLFYLFAAVSAFTGVYSMFFCPETKGLSCDAIQDKFTKKRNKSVF